VEREADRSNEPVRSATAHGLLEGAQEKLHARLWARRDEIAATVMVRLRAISGPEENPDPEYAEGLRSAVQTAVDYGIEAVRCDEEDGPAVPTALLEQVRMTARYGIDLDVVLRRYLAGYSLLGTFLIEEAEESGLLRDASLRQLLWVQTRLFDRLIAVVSEEYRRELRPRPQSPAQRRIERVERLLAGEPLETVDLGYDLEGWHVGLIASGEAATEAMRRLATTLGWRSILVNRPEGDVWAWMGGKRRPRLEELEHVIAADWPRTVPVAIGEPGSGRHGWRLTHQQAKAAMPMARRDGSAFVRYREVALVSSVSRDDLLATSLRDIYLAPLEEAPDGSALIETLRTYFASDRNVSSTAAALRVNRRTVANRLRTIEARLGCTLIASTAEIEAALRLQELDAAAASAYAT
jgi:hypothetical protein